MALLSVVSLDCQVLQQEVERLEARAALVEEEASRAGQLEEEAAARAEQLRALQEKAGALLRSHSRVVLSSLFGLGSQGGGGVTACLLACLRPLAFGRASRSDRDERRCSYSRRACS